MKLNPDNHAGISNLNQREYLNTAYKLNFLSMSVIAVFVFLFFSLYKQIETLSKLRIMTVPTVFFMPLFESVKRKETNKIEVQWYKDKKSAAINYN